MKQPAKPQIEIMVSIILHERIVCRMERLKYSLKSQNPPSLTCEKIRLPDPVASTRSTGLIEVIAYTGANIPAVVNAATVAEPTAIRINAAIPQHNKIGDISTPPMASIINSFRPASTKTCLSAPAPPTMSKIMAIPLIASSIIFIT